MVVAEEVAPETVKPKDTLAVDFPDEDIRSILRNVADLFELNLVIPDTLQGRTSIKLRDVTWRQIFSVILQPIGYTFVEDGNIIKVVTTDSLAAEPVTTEVFIINYAKASEILPTINPLVEPSKGGRVQVDTRSNALIITERPSKLVSIRPIIDKLDKATEQVMIESKFIEVQANQAKELGLDWSLAAGAVGDVAGSSRGGNRNNPPVAAALAPQLAPFTNSTDYATSVLSSAQLAATLNFLENKDNVRVVNNPTLVTLNNTEAEINVGTEFPIPSYSYNAERGAFEISGFEYKPIGVLLKVTPQINSQGFVRLTVEPEISSSNTSVNFGGGGGSSAEIPIIETRKTKTQVSLKDGHTLGIGGLITDTVTKGENKLPFFGDIPGIGRLFRSESDSKNRLNLMIFITAKIVSAETAPVEEIYDPRQISDVGLKRSDLPGFRSTESALAPEIVVAPEGPAAP
ncbi:MAG: secretin N-terminal domain-containing protein [Verrucomicrobiota bacterium]